MNPNNDVHFLPIFIHEGIYIIPETFAMEEKNVCAASNSEAEVSEVQLPTKSIIASDVKKNGVAQSPQTRKRVKLLILVGYQTQVPTKVRTALENTCKALHIPDTDFYILNALDKNEPLVDDIDFTYILLMGGNGRNINVLKNYHGKRAFLEVGMLGSKTIIFAEAMDKYLEDKTLASRFWQLLQSHIH